jgi:hypothetical protein
MSNIQSFIYYDICERSLMAFECAKMPKHMSYRGFCLNIKTSIRLKQLTLAETRPIIKVQNYLSQVYGLSFSEAMEYIYDFFINEKWLLFEETVRLMKIYFRNSVI